MHCYKRFPWGFLLKLLFYVYLYTVLPLTVWLNFSLFEKLMSLVKSRNIIKIHTWLRGLGALNSGNHLEQPAMNNTFLLFQSSKPQNQVCFKEFFTVSVKMPKI